MKNARKKEETQRKGNRARPAAEPTEVKPPEQRPPHAKPENLPLEDMVLKTAIQYFGDVLLPFLGIHDRVTVAAPTEQVYMEVRRLTEDYNFTVEDGSWLHLEFESDSVKKEDLRRFRSYEAVISYTYHVPVVTYVICSSTVRRIQSRLTEGINSYRVKVIRLKNWNADRLFRKLFQKKAAGEIIQREELIPVLAAPLMSGTMTTRDRIINGNKLLQDSDGLSREEIISMQAVLYALANKFLSNEDLNQVKEGLSMTRLGEMLRQDGIALGIEQGIQAMVSTLQELNFSQERTREKIKEKFGLTAEQAAAYVQKFWT